MYGTISLYSVAQDGSKQLLLSQHNQIQDDYSVILSHLLSGDTSHKINTMYIEFVNVANPSDTVTTTNFATTDGADYFANLNGNADFLRVTLSLNPTIDADGITFIGCIGNSSGVHELDFGAAAVNSKVTGLALVAAPDSADQSKDLVFSRTNLQTQVLKENSKQLYIAWSIRFTN